MTRSIKSFLQLLKDNADRNLNQSSVLGIVCGNEAADFDSVVSALAYAFCSYHHDPENLVVPIINIPRADLRLRKDVVRALNRLDITEDLLFFNEELRRYKNQYNSINAVLVDHNELESSSKSLINNVTGIIDHHKDQNLYLEANPRIVETTGSCSSLVFNYWYKTMIGLESAKYTKEITLLVMGAVLLDTSNFQHKVEAPDLEALKCYEKIIPNFDRAEYYAQLKKDKDDLEGLHVKEIFKKDYKEFVFEDNSEKLVIGIASIGKSLQWLTEQCGGEAEFKKECIEVQKERNVNIFAIMTAWQDDHDFKRQLLVVSPLKNQSERIVGQIAADLKLDKSQFSVESAVDEPYYLNAFQQLNVVASRKQVVPLLKDAFHSTIGK